jgi:hypothetical protein
MRAMTAAEEREAIAEEVRTRNDARRFARLNGWGQSRRGFSMGRLARLHACNDFPLWYFGGHRHPGMDHLYYFKANGRPVAIVTMPYHASRGELRAVAKEYGLDVRAPPIAKSGWWFPGHTFCFVFVRAGTQVKWLPEQSRAAAK